MARSRIFISYRRDDAAGYSHAIHDRLADHLGGDQIFMDVHDIAPGTDFARRLRDVVQGCDVVVALIGKRWVGEREGQPARIHDERDWVRIEVAEALRTAAALVGAAHRAKQDFEQCKRWAQPLLCFFSAADGLAVRVGVRQRVRARNCVHASLWQPDGNAKRDSDALPRAPRLLLQRGGNCSHVPRRRLLRGRRRGQCLVLAADCVYHRGTERAAAVLLECDHAGGKRDCGMAGWARDCGEARSAS